MSFKKEISNLSHKAKSWPVNICKTAYSCQGCVKNMIFGLNLGEKIGLFCLNSTFLELEPQKIKYNSKTRFRLGKDIQKRVYYRVTVPFSSKTLMALYPYYNYIYMYT